MINDKPTELVFISISSVPTQIFTLFSPTAVLNARRRTICPVCTTDSEQPVMIEAGKEWELHQNSRTHRKLINRAIRRKCGQQRHATSEYTKGQRTVSKDAWLDLDESVMSIFPP
jgi:tRNA dimethylallyltransferase